MSPGGASANADRAGGLCPEPVALSQPVGAHPLRVAQFACACSAQSEGIGPAPRCWRCDKPMYQWGERLADFAPTVINGVSADTRTANGGY